MKSFKYWTRQDIADEFGLTTASKCLELEKWESIEVGVTEREEETLLRLQEKLKKYVDIWNEQELIIKFISFIIELVDFDNQQFKSFANRKLKGKIQNKEVSGEVDLMIASGEYEPKEPYFCLHEYKKEKGTDNDPLGQLLIAMMTASALNGNKLPVYGAYVIGRNWFFLTLVENRYCISEELVATREDIFEILKMMKRLKIIIENQVLEKKGESAPKKK